MVCLCLSIRRSGSRSRSRRFLQEALSKATYYTCNDTDELTHHMKDDVYTYFTYDNDGNQNL